MMEIQKAEMLATPVQLPPHIEVSTCEGKTKEAACVSPEIVPAKPNRMSILDSWSDDEENASGACMICLHCINPLFMYGYRLYFQVRLFALKILMMNPVSNLLKRSTWYLIYSF